MPDKIIGSTEELTCVLKTQKRLKWCIMTPEGKMPSGGKVHFPSLIIKIVKNPNNCLCVLILYVYCYNFDWLSQKICESLGPFSIKNQ